MDSTTGESSLSLEVSSWCPTPLEVVGKLLWLARVGSGDVLCDLGCGDGRILFAAVEDFGVRKAIGYEIREDLYEICCQNIVSHNLDGRVVVVNRDLFDADI